MRDEVELARETGRHFRQELQKMFETLLILEYLPAFNPAIDHMIPTSGANQFESGAPAINRSIFNRVESNNVLYVKT
jgi:hypothetical protein